MSSLDEISGVYSPLSSTYVNPLPLLRRLRTTTTHTHTPIARAKDAVTMEATTADIIMTVFRRDCAPGVTSSSIVVAESAELEVVVLSLAVDEVVFKKVVVMSVKPVSVVGGVSVLVVERFVAGVSVVVSMSFELVLTSSVVLGFLNVDVPTSVVVSGAIVTVLNVVGIVAAAAVVASFTF